MNYIETLQKADINISSAGDNTVISAPTTDPNAYIAIDHINFVVNGTVTVQFKDGTTVYGGPYALAQGQGVTLENAMHNEHGIITLGVGNPFKMNLSAGVQVSGFIRYRIVNK